MGCIANSIYIVTGAAGNIGREVAATLSQLGAGVIGLDIAFPDSNPPMEAPKSGQIINFKLDLTDETGVEHFFVALSSKDSHKINGLVRVC